MKKLVFGLMASVLFVPSSFGQSNNPYNALGADVVRAANAVYKDYQSGKIKDIDQATLDHYFKNLLPNATRVKLDEFTKIFNAMKNTTNKGAIANSGFSEEGKAFLTKSYTNVSITALVDEVKKSKISESEKESVLSALAINYNLLMLTGKTKDAEAIQKNAKGPNADLEFNDVLAVGTTVNPVGGYSGAWGAIGFVMGFSMCGLPCAITGGIIGLVVGSGSNSSNTTITPGGGGGSGGGGWNPKP